MIFKSVIFSFNNFLTISVWVSFSFCSASALALASPSWNPKINAWNFETCVYLGYLTSLPIFTIENSLLLSILKRNNLSEEEINKILEYKEEEKNTNLILENNIIIDNCYEFDNSYLALENIFYEKKIYYTKTEFNKHLKSTKEYTKKNKNYFLNISNNKVFKNINITILTNNYVIVSKSNNPVIHFVIKHEKLMNAITDFYPIVKE